MRWAWVPGALLVNAAGMHYGDEALSALTGWDLSWSYAVCQAIGQAVLWVMVIALVRPGILLVPGVMACTIGAAESLMRAGCLVAQIVDPIDLRGQNLCDARLGVELSAWGLAAIAVCASALGAWAAHKKH